MFIKDNVPIHGNAVVTVKELIVKGIVKNPRDGVKILGEGELTKKLTVQVDAFSASAKEKIEAVGGKAEVKDLGGRVQRKALRDEAKALRGKAEVI